MFKNYFTIAVRNTIKHKGYSFINIIGLAVGLASFIVIMLYVYDELSYDQFHTDADRIYRVVFARTERDGSNSSRIDTPGALKEAMVEEISEIEHATRLHSSSWGKVLLSNAKYTYYDKNLLYVGASFFDVFSSQFIDGEANSAFVHPGSIVLTESVTGRSLIS
jgi:putative ABC transport system permease protein